jgi:hypothetical protein
MRAVATLEAGKRASMNANKVWFMAGTLLLSGLAGFSAFAAGAGEVVHLSGTLSVQRPDGAILVLGQKSEVRPGDVLATQKDSYAQINFSDGSTVTMRPYTQLKIDAYSFVQEKPEADSAFFRLIKGGLRTVTGLVGKRGNQNAYRIGTTTATIGIRGSTGDTMVCDPSCDGVAKGSEALPSGTHHQTHSGSYIMEAGGKTVVIEEGYSAHANVSGVINLIKGPIGGGILFIDLRVPSGQGLKGAGCK